MVLFSRGGGIFIFAESLLAVGVRPSLLYVFHRETKRAERETGYLSLYLTANNNV